MNYYYDDHYHQEIEKNHVEIKSKDVDRLRKNKILKKDFVFVCMCEIYSIFFSISNLFSNTLEIFFRNFTFSLKLIKNSID